MVETIKKLVLVSRPISWPNTAYPFAATYLMAGGVVDWRFALATLFFLFPYNLLMYGVNDVFDYESDIRNPRKGGIEGMREQREFHPTIIRAVLITSVPLVAILLTWGDSTARLALSTLIFLVVAYSLSGLRFKEIPMLDSMTSSSHFVGPMVYALTLTSFVPGVWPYVLAFFLWGMASHAFGAVQDIIPDKNGGLASIATGLGARRTILFVSALYMLAAVLVIRQGFPGAFVGLMGLIYVANALQFSEVTDETSATVNAGWRRFIWMNLATGFVLTLVLIWTKIVS